MDQMTDGGSRLENPTLLDCTFRDGGYYNNWEFTDTLFQAYLKAIDSSAFKMAEVGFRFKPKTFFMGPHAYTSDEYLLSFELPSATKLGVMLNASDFIGVPDIQASIINMFRPSSDSPVDFVRIATHGSEMSSAAKIAKHITNMGYEVAINLMQVSEFDIDELTKLLVPLEGLDLFAFYVADSLGSLTPDRVTSIFSTLTENTSFALGIHSHDNLGLALQNSLAAFARGASYVDGTLLGMGRGPGNTKSEELAISLASSDKDTREGIELGKFAVQHFSKLQQDLGWGRNFQYFVAGLKGVHPTYVQEMTVDSRFDAVTIIDATYELSQLDSNRFDPNVLRTLGVSSDFAGEPDTPRLEAEKWHPSSAPAALILGPGELSSTSKRELNLFLAKNSDYLLLCVNGSPALEVANLSYRVVSTPRRIATLSKSLQDVELPWIAPVDRFGDQFGLLGGRTFDYPFTLGDEFSFTTGGIVSPIDNVFAYAAGIALQCEVSRIYMAGFDGLRGADHRNYEMVEMLRVLTKDVGVSVLSLTRTNLPVAEISVFAV